MAGGLEAYSEEAYSKSFMVSDKKALLVGPLAIIFSSVL